MRFKVMRDEKLSKAIDRSKLVLVEVPVQGKTKSYRANRWKNPNQALKLLVKELEKQNIPNIEDIKFKDKTTGKSYDKEELVSEYKKANSNKTLQEFVKERYTIVKPKESKNAKASTKTVYDGEKPNKENDGLSNAEKQEKRMERLKTIVEAYRQPTYEGMEKILGKEYMEASGTTDDEYLQQKRPGIISKYDFNVIYSNYKKGNINLLKETINLLKQYDDGDRTHPGLINERYNQDTTFFSRVSLIVGSLRANNYIGAQKNIDEIEADLLLHAGKKSVYKKIINEIDGKDENPSKQIPYEKFRKLTDDGKLDLYTSNKYKPWAAEITGLGMNDSIERNFLQSYDGIYDVEDGKVYEVNEKGKRYYLYIKDGQSYSLNNEELINHIKSQKDYKEFKPTDIGVERPKLKGSERQVSWAEEIREKFMEEVKPSVDEMKKYQESGTDAQKEIANKYLQAVELITKDDNSVNWIQTYRLSTKDSVSNMLAGLKKVESFGERSNNIREELPDLGDEKTNRIRSEIMYKFAYPMSDIINNGGITNPDAARAIIDGFDAIDDLKQIKDKDFWNFASNYMDSFGNPRANLNQDLKNKEKALKDYVNNPISGNVGDLIRITKLSQANKVASRELYEDTAKDKEVAKKEARYNLMNAALVYIECKDATLEQNERWKNRSLEYANIKEENIPHLRDALNYNSLKFWAEANGTPNEIAEKYKAEKGKDKEELKTTYPRWTAKMRFGTKTIKSDPTVIKVKTLSAVEDGLKKFKGAHTDIVARKAMDLMGLNAPLYVKRNGKPFPLKGIGSAAGYCQYTGIGADATVQEIGVVDYMDKRHSYKTTIHECMHGLLGEIKTNDKKDIVAMNLNNKSHEGLVEIIAQSSLKSFYGKDNVKDMSPSYLPFVADTALRLSKLDMYKGMSITEIGRALGEHAINRNEKYINYVAEYLNKNVKEEKAAPTETVDNKIKENPNILDEKANKIVNDNKGFEKSDLAMLVEELKSGRITLSQALINSKYQELAAILIVEILDEKDEDLDIPLF